MDQRESLRAVYASYDGALDPLGASQVVPYLRGLASTKIAFTLVSFEKVQRWGDSARRQALAAELESRGVEWRPRRYHSRPRLVAKLYDLVAGAAAVRAAVRSSRASLVHCRGEVAMAMARCALLPRDVRLLYDIRGLFAEERAASGSWRRGGLIDRLVRRIERSNYRRADGIVVLTTAARDYLSETCGRLPPHAVIPTCVDLDRFAPSPADRPARFGLVYAGALGARHVPRELVRFMEHATAALGRRALFVTPDVSLAQAAGVSDRWAEVRAASPDEVPALLASGQASVMFYTGGTHLKGVMPTKLGEALACGLPVVASAGIGDVDQLIERGRTGVVVRGFSAEDFADATSKLLELLADSDTRARCRRMAETEFALSLGVKRYRALYDALLSSPGR